MFITAETDIGRPVRLPAELAGKAKSMPYRDYCIKLFHSCHELNGRDDLRLTLHLNYAEFEKAMAELQKFARDTGRFMGAAAAALAAEQCKNCLIAGVTITCDAVDFV